MLDANEQSANARPIADVSLDNDAVSLNGDKFGDDASFGVFGPEPRKSRGNWFVVFNAHDARILLIAMTWSLSMKRLMEVVPTVIERHVDRSRCMISHLVSSAVTLWMLIPLIHVFILAP